MFGTDLFLFVWKFQIAEENNQSDEVWQDPLALQTIYYVLI